jgi:hypothetical protein
VRAARTAVGLLALAAGVALLVWYAGRIGREAILAGLTAVGAGFAGVLLLSLLRYVARTAAWITLIPVPVPAGRALAATIGGDALGAITPFGVFVGEPAKALFLERAVGVSGTLAPLAAENFFYGLSIAIYILLGSAAMLAAFTLPDPVQLAGMSALALAAVGLACGGWLAWKRPSYVAGAIRVLPGTRARAALERLQEFEQATYASYAAPGAPLGRVALAEGVFHGLSFLEAWFTLWLLTGTSQPLEAFVLDACGRVFNIVFRMVPLRIGVDQAGAGLVAQGIGLDPATGVALSLVRTTRLFVWSIVGVGFLAARVRR